MNNFLEVILQNEREALLKAILEGVQKDLLLQLINDIVVTTAVALTMNKRTYPCFGS